VLRKDIITLVRAIRKTDNNTVRLLLDRTPELARATAQRPPKKDDGQSPLQIAFKVGNFEAAKALLDAGADPNYQESSSINEWTAPVLHDAIRATIFSSKTLRNDEGNFLAGLALTRAMLVAGADPNKTDSYGNTSGMRAVLDARQMLLHPDVKPDPEGTADQVRRVFALLQEFGADFDLATQTRHSARDEIKTSGLSQFHLLPSTSSPY
jgi:hypothetical protein